LAVSSQCSPCGLRTLTRSSGVLCPLTTGRTVCTMPSLQNSKCEVRHSLVGYQGIASCSLCPSFI
jgi:hypothetical protein